MGHFTTHWYETILADPDDRDLVPKVVLPIANFEQKGASSTILVGEKAVQYNPLLELREVTESGNTTRVEPNLHGLAVASAAADS